MCYRMNEIILTNLFEDQNVFFQIEKKNSRLGFSIFKVNLSDYGSSCVVTAETLLLFL